MDSVLSHLFGSISPNVKLTIIQSEDRAVVPNYFYLSGNSAKTELCHIPILLAL